ncbi:hypothetical protein [Telmatospirillum sp.]|uniref:hypothetical protein n=1 Tax=Telmatospirillum sp. TaxID=2079197 RepID=UPI00284AC596|nr:hypothetical protein [Telmatospirillum sp.]MDR3435946.1 hypothetical protein [Telmatospirillum sp.]
MTFVQRSIVLLSTLLALSACKSLDKEEPPLCPHVSMLADSAAMTRFAPGGGQEEKDRQFKAELTSFHGVCRYDPEAKKMLFTLNVGIDAERYPALAGGRADIAYYVAIPAFYPDPQGKALFPVRLDFSQDSKRLHVTDDELEIAIPMSADPKELGKYEVFLGLQLTPAELAYNRQHREDR